MSEAEESGWWSGLAGVRKHYEKAVEYSPNHPEALYALGAFILEHDRDEPAAESYFNRALDHAGKNEQLFSQIIAIWLNEAENERAEAVYQRVKTQFGQLDQRFYITILIACHTLDRDDLAEIWLARIYETSEPGTPVLYEIGRGLVMTQAKDAARMYLKRAIKTDEKVGYAYEALAVLDTQLGDPDSAEQHWKQAERIANRTHDQELKDIIKTSRELFNNPLGSILGRMLGSGAGPGLLNMLGNMDSMDPDSVPPEFMQAFFESMMDEFDDEDDEDGWF